MLGPDAMRKELQAITAATSKPYNVNFFVHQQPVADAARETAWRRILAPYFAEYGIDPSAIVPVPRGCRSMTRRRTCSRSSSRRSSAFTLDCRRAALLARVKSWGSKILSSATTVDEARYLEAHGVDAVIAQGLEAGGHRGMFLTDDLTTQVGTLRAGAADRAARYACR